MKTYNEHNKATFRDKEDFKEKLDALSGHIDDAMSDSSLSVDFQLLEDVIVLTSNNRDWCRDFAEYRTDDYYTVAQFLAHTHMLAENDENSEAMQMAHSGLSDLYSSILRGLTILQWQGINVWTIKTFTEAVNLIKSGGVRLSVLDKIFEHSFASALVNVDRSNIQKLVADLDNARKAIDDLMRRDQD